MTVPVTACDKWWNPHCQTVVTEISVKRNAWDPTTSTGPSNPRQQVNGASAFLDASFVYGNDDARSADIRAFSGGKLHSDAANGVPRNAWGFPMAGHGHIDSSRQRLTGDPRGNENPGLLAVTGLWVLEHNRQCDELAKAHPTWDDNRLYHEARKRVIALLQHVTYSEYLPLLLGEPLAPYTGYSSAVDPSVSGEFAVAAYRYGHSGINSAYWTITATGEEHRRGPILLRDAYFNPSYLDTCTVGDILRGLVYQPESSIDLTMVDDARLFLEGVRLDLAAIDIMRGRDFGVPSYSATRFGLGLGRVTSFADITGDARAAQQLEAAYAGDVHAVDLWVGGLAEEPVQGGLVGPTFAAIIREQFLNTRDADRFWYENTANVGMDGEAYIGTDLLQEIRQTKYSDIIARNIGEVGVPPSVLRVPDPHSLDVQADGAVQPSSTPAPVPTASPAPAVTTSPGGAGAQPSNNTENAGNGTEAGASTERVVTAGPIEMRWTPPTEEESSITMSMKFDGTGWFAWGIGSGMADGDVIMMRYQGGQGEAVDAKSSGYMLPSADGSQDVQLVEASEVDGQTMITWQRDLETGDSEDKALERGDTSIPMMLAWSKNSDTYGFHGTDYVMGNIDLWTAPEAGNEGTNGGFAAIEGDNSAYVQAFGYHGLSMFLVWGILVPSAVFTVRFAKTNPMWLAYHRWASMLAATITFPAAGSALITVGSATQRAHAYVGISLTLAMLLQIVSGAIIRHWMKEKATPPMKYFVPLKSVHKLFGWFLLALGLTQCFLGVSMLLPHLTTTYIIIVIVVCALFFIAVLHNEYVIYTTDAATVKKEAYAAMQTSSAAMTVTEVRQRLRQGAKWIILDGAVYDVGTFMKSHPGGAYFLNRVIGSDVGALFYGHEPPDKHVPPHRHSARAFKLLQKLCVGVLLRDDADPSRSWVDIGPTLDLGPDKWHVVSKRKVTSGRSPVWRMEFASPRANAVPADQWSISSLGRHMMVLLPPPGPFERGPMAWCLRAAGITPTTDSTTVSPWHNAARSYSIVRQDDKANILMYIRAYRSGLVSPKVTALEPGDKVFMEGPHGLGMLENQASGVIFGIAQGTCMAPFFDLITHLVARSRVAKATAGMPREQIIQAGIAESDLGTFSAASEDDTETSEQAKKEAWPAEQPDQPPLQLTDSTMEPHPHSGLLQTGRRTSTAKVVPLAHASAGEPTQAMASTLSARRAAAAADQKAGPAPASAHDQPSEHQPDSAIGLHSGAVAAVSPVRPVASSEHSHEGSSTQSQTASEGGESALIKAGIPPRDPSIPGTQPGTHHTVVRTGQVQRTAVELQSSAASEGEQTTTILNTASAAYQHEIAKEQLARKRAKPLKLVLLSMFHDTADIIEPDWLQRMESECENIELHFRVSVNSLGTSLPPRYFTHRVTPKVLQALMPSQDLHSIVVCGSHAFKGAMTKMLKQLGLPTTRITTL